MNLSRRPSIPIADHQLGRQPGRNRGESKVERSLGEIGLRRSSKGPVSGVRPMRFYARLQRRLLEPELDRRFI